MDINQLTEAVIGAAIEVHRAWDRGCSNPPICSVFAMS